MSDPGLRALLRHPVAQNIFALSWVQLATYVIPLVTLPYLARQLGPSGLGLVVFAQSLALTLNLLLEYGFSLSATREIARRRGRQSEVATIAAGVLGAKLVLLAAITVLALVCMLAIPEFRHAPEYLWLAWLDAVALGLLPGWYFQGIERMRLFGAAQVAARVLTAIGIFVLIDDHADGWKVLALQAAFDGLCAIVLFGVMARGIELRRPTVRSALATLRHGRSMFALNGAVSLYTTLNPFVLGLVAPQSQVGFFGGAEKVTRAASRFMVPISMSLFPRVSSMIARDAHAAARRLARRALLLQTVLAVAAAGALVALAPWVVELLFGPRFDAAVPVMRILALILPLIAVSNVLGIQWMLPLGLDRSFVAVCLGAGVLNVVLLLTLGSAFGAEGGAWAVVAAEAAVVAGLVAVLWRRRLLPVGG